MMTWADRARRGHHHHRHHHHHHHYHQQHHQHHRQWRPGRAEQGAGDQGGAEELPRSGRAAGWSWCCWRSRVRILFNFCGPESQTSNCEDKPVCKELLGSLHSLLLYYFVLCEIKKRSCKVERLRRGNQREFNSSPSLMKNLIFLSKLNFRIKLFPQGGLWKSTLPPNTTGLHELSIIIYTYPCWSIDSHTKKFATVK